MSTYRVKTKESGFTLVESLVYIGLFVLISTGAIMTLLSLQQLFSQYQVKQSLFVASTNIMERVLVEVREAEDIFTTQSIFNDSQGGIVLQGESGTLEFRVEDNQLLLTEDGNTSVLHADNVAVDEFWIWHYEASQSQLVRFMIRITASVGNYSETIELNGGAVARGLYVGS